MAVTSPKSLPPVKATRVPSGRCALVSRSLRGALEVASVDGRGGEPSGLRDMAAASRAPDFAGLDAVGLGGEVAHLLEGVAAVGEVLRAGGDELQLAGLDLGAVLFALQVAEFGHELVGGAVEAPGLGIEHVDVAPQQALAFVGELGSVHGDAVGENAEALGDRGERVVAVPDLAAVELAALGCCAVECGALADRGGGGPVLVLHGVDVRDVVHDGLRSDGCADRSTLLMTVRIPAAVPPST